MNDPSGHPPRPPQGTEATELLGIPLPDEGLPPRGLLERLFQLPVPEREIVFLLFAYAFATAAAYVVGRSVADGIFLSRIGPERLPGMYMLSAAVVAAISIAYSAIAARFRLDTIVRLTLICLAGSSIVLCQLLESHRRSWSVVAAVYLLAELRGCLNSIQFSTLINELFATGDPRRVFGFVGAGATLAGMIFGGLVGWNVYHVGTGNLLYLVALLELAALVPLIVLRRRLKARNATAPDRASGSALVTIRERTLDLKSAMGSPYTRCVAGLVALKVVVITIVEYQWKMAAADSFAGAEDRLTSYFGLYYGCVYLLTGLIQLFVTPRYLRQFGLLAGLMIFPGSLLVATTGMMAASLARTVFWAATLAKGCDTLRRGIDDSACNILFWPMATGARRQTIALVGGVAKPLAEGLAGFLILELFMRVPPHQLSHMAFVLTVGWMCLAVRCRQHYRSEMLLAAVGQNLDYSLTHSRRHRASGGAVETASASLPGYGAGAGGGIAMPADPT